MDQGEAHEYQTARGAASAASRTSAPGPRTGGTLLEVPTRSTKLSQYCHGCGTLVIGPLQRDLYSAFLAAFLDPADPIPSCAQYSVPWEGAGVGGEARLLAAHERVKQRGV